jgi:colanic acid/amylovoran biosynthesis glycosyltransferase
MDRGADPTPLRRIAYLINQYPKVSHTFIRREMQALERQGLEVERFALRGWDAPTPDDADRAERARTRYLLRPGALPLVGATVAAAFGAPVRFVQTLVLALRMARHGERPWPYHLIYLAEACRLRRWLRESKSEHLHAHFGTNSAEVAMLVHALGGPPYSFTVHGPEEFDKPGALHLGEKVRRAAFVVAIGSYGRSQLYRWAGHLDWPRIEVVHCGLDADFLAAPSTAPPDVARLVCIGRLCEQKGQLLLVEAASRLVRAGVPLQLVLAGDGEMRGAIEALVHQRSLGDHVRITGWIGSDQVREELVGARALVLPSFAEGLPVVIMEAMALGRPVISTYVAGIPELVRNGEDGWLVPAGDIDALAESMRACLTAQPVELARMGEAARARVRARHDVDVEAAKLARLFAKAPGPPVV